MNSKDLIKLSSGQASAWLHRFAPRSPRETVGILLYHRISPIIQDVREPDINVTPATFRSQLEGLRESGHEFCKLQDILDCVTAGNPIPEQTTIVTFDDGFENVYLNAWPVLQELKIPSTIFLNTAYLGSNDPFPFDPWGTEFRDCVPLHSYRPLSHEQCREMLSTGLVELGAHTHTHDDFRGQPERFANDLQENLRLLRESFAIDRVTFAFPYGRIAEGYAGGELTEAARRVGVRCALTTECDRNLASGDSFSWGRCNVYEWDTPTTLQAKLAGWYSWAPKLQDLFMATGR
ncbi:MAG TPA: polysaccharide deacetylase family protein [Pirellulaceae bacterium]|nr:polysaccharide deacetylase family protein [Planctomycetales bacterium]MCB9941476.1 polysaccharide deacetylase family protein [Planctomycetaceae bacterium]HRX81123.1 polysaccharide deacetylase family protein [Pirellulaceae bacterium]